MRTLLAMILLAVSTLCAAADRVIVMPAVEPHFAEDGNAGYQRLVREILRRSGNDINIEYYPLARSIQVFDQNRNACFPAARKIAFGFLGHDVIDAGVAINKFNVVVATRKSDPQIISASALRNRSVAARLGQALGVYGIPVSTMKIHYVASMEQAISLLEKGRVQAVIGTATGLLPYRSSLNFDRNRPLFSIDETIVCHPGAESEAFLRSIRPAIKSMLQDGSLKSILGEYYQLN